MKHVFSWCLKGVAGMILMLSCFALSAQPKLNLHRGTIQLTANLDQFLQQPDLQREIQQIGYAYRLLQFHQIPSATQQAELARAGVKLMDYLPEHTYLAVVSPHADLQRLQSSGVRAVYALSQEDRVTTAVWNQDFPPYALEGDEVWLQLALMPDLRPSFVQAQLEAMESEVEAISVENRYARVRLPMHRIPDLATASFLLLADVIQPEGEPEDIRGLSLHRSNVLNGAYNGARDYDGTGVSVAVRDDGTVGPHIDFQGRLDNGLSTPTAGTHGDRVAGVVGGFGNLDPTVQGMAPGSFIYAMDYQANFLDSTIGLHNSLGVMITNSSYSNGCNAGYTVITNIVDGQAYDYPSLLHVFSGGNSNGSDCGYGAGSQWGNVTGGHKMGKNVLTVAALDISDQITNFSSRGPAHDGRIKPDISGLGAGVRMPSNDNTYTTSGGTSFSAPGLAGISAQLYHAYRELNGGTDPTSALIKATLLNTADDLGNVGPDFIYGWGRVNARQAVEVLEASQYLSSQADQGDSLGFQISIPANTKEARIMLYWAEEPSTVLTNKALINDLNLQVRDGSGQVHFPWVLDPTPNPTALNTPATNGIDSLNNMEQVILADPAAGPIDVSVLATSIPKGPQEFYLVYAFLPDEVHMTYPMGGESFVPGITERIRWDALGTSPADGTFTLEYSTDGGGSWQVINSNIAASARFYDWSVPNLVNGQVRMRISRGGLSSSSVADFTIVGQPQNLALEQVCPNTLTFSWSAVGGATEYEIFLLGEKYMDSVLVVPAQANPEATISIQDENAEHWVSVRALGPNGARGRRAIALQHSGGRVNCPIDNDMAINSVSPASGGPFLDCGGSTSQVQIQLLNQSGAVLSNIPIFYQLDNQAIISEVYNGSIVPNVPVSHTFSTPLDLPAAGTFELKAWTGQPLDTIPGNDTSFSEITVFPSTVLTAPFIQDFESTAPCGTSSNCGGEVCPLEDGWINVENGEDDIDWRVDRGGTPSNGTGPFVDHRPGSSSGNYLYLEASAGCENQVAELVSPCLDLSGTLAPQLVFWYHMTGNDVGTLAVDININGIWLTNFGGVLSGDQGNQWLSRTLNLSGFIGQTINVRFRGTTGGGWSSDIAIDDISLIDPAGAPAAYFVADREEACVGTPITFIESSLNLPANWEWSFSPNAVTYLNGTTANSQQPQVSFAQAGTYEVQLIASNANGGDTLIRTQYIHITPGTGPDVVEDFESGIFPPVEWQIDNPDALNSWEPIQTTGINGATTTAAYVNNDQLEANGQEDRLVPIAINLAGATDPTLNFDVAYGQRAGSSVDLLRVELSQDCGETYPVVLFEKSGAILATTNSTDLNWFPQSGNDWRTEMIDLAPFNGNTVMVRFVNRNGGGNSNNLFVDNIQVIEEGLAAPTADFSSSAVLVCEGSALSFFDESQGQNISGFSWDFGADAQPATASTAGPHSVSYASPGIKTITLTTTNAAGSNSISKIIEVSPLPDPDFTFDRVVATYTFTNISVNADSFQWDFGDGTTSTLENPEHEYILNGSYDVMLIAFNDCGPDTLVQKLEVFAVSRTDLLEAGIQLFPNPTTGQVALRMDQAGSLDWQVEVTDLRGKRLFGKQLAPQVQGIQTSLDLSLYPDGVYLIHLTSGNQRWTQKLLLQR